MNWKLVVSLSGLGVLMGGASVLGLTRGSEGVLWLILAALATVVIVRKAQTRPLLHGFFVGFIGGGLAPVVQSLFFATYLANNPEVAEPFSRVPSGLGARYFVLILAPVIGLVSGVVLGLMCWLGVWLEVRRKGPPAEGT
jgi:Na+/serine symporter